MSEDILPDFSSLSKSIFIGRLYEHYKGHRYKILGIARHTETLEEMVIYQPLYGKGDIWVRPLNMFIENVIINGSTVPRFKLIEELIS